MLTQNVRSTKEMNVEVARYSLAKRKCLKGRITKLIQPISTRLTEENFIAEKSCKSILKVVQYALLYSRTYIFMDFPLEIQMCL